MNPEEMVVCPNCGGIDDPELCDICLGKGEVTRAEDRDFIEMVKAENKADADPS